MALITKKGINMQDKVLIDNYIQYVNHRLDSWKSEQAKHKEKYAKAKEDYENKPINKFFGWKFENSYESGGWCKDASSPWDYSYTTLINQCQSELNRLCYQKQIGINLITFNTGYFSIRDFYKYCKDVGLP